MFIKREISFIIIIFAILISVANCFALKGNTENTHDRIMAINKPLLEKRSNMKTEGTAKESSAVGAILKVDQALGVDLYEGDIKLDKTDRKLIKENPDGKDKRAMTGYQQKLWTTRKVPYEIVHQGTSKHSASVVYSKILEALAEIQKVSCITFRRKVSSDLFWIRYEKKVGCYSDIGRSFSKYNPTSVSLGESCITLSIIIHETLHALGFWHEQSRPDRDSFVKIYWENIRTGMESNFQRQKSYEVNIQDTIYDYKSIMHYSQTAFTVQGKNTIEAIHDSSMQLGGTKLSALDIIELNKMYRCSSTATTGFSQWSSWSSCFIQVIGCARIKQRFCFGQNCPGADYSGVETIKEKCQSCQEILNGHWGQWGSWNACSKSCGEGTFTRKRKCNNPVPSTGGKKCIGSSSKTSICRIKKCDQKWYDTSFDNGWGMWRNDGGDAFDWTRQTGSTPTQGTGPNSDHTTGNGYYVFVESATSRHFQKANLKSSKLPSNFGKKCLSFFYSMNGKHMGSLEIYLKTNAGSYVNLGWKRSGHQGTDWKGGAITLPQLAEGYEIYFEAKIGYSPNSDIALDDIFIDDGECVKGMEGCSDHHAECQSWASTGECLKNTFWMLRNCCPSCTGVDGYDCSDKDTQCTKWAKDGYCNQNYKGQPNSALVWMTKNCCRSCKNCLDTDSQCPHWKSIGECTKNPTWMSYNCATSCGICPS